MLHIYLLVLLVEVIACQHGEYLVNVEHKIGKGEWSKRATLILPMIKQSSLPVHNTPQYIPIVANERIEELVAAGSDNETLYHIRVPFKAVEEGESEDIATFVSAVIRSCLLVESDLKHSLIIHMDSSGYITGLSVYSGVSECVGKITTASAFTTESTVSYPQVGASPDVHSFIVIKEKEDKKKSDESKDNRSFLAKYWMYILPVALLMMMNMGAQ